MGLTLVAIVFGAETRRRLGCIAVAAALLLPLIFGTAARAASQSFPIAIFPDDTSDHGLVLSGDVGIPRGAGPFPAIVLLHGCGGYTDRFRRTWPDHLNSLGYVTFTVDSFGPRGFRRCNRKLFDMRGADRAARDRYLARDAYGALDFLAALPVVDPDRIAVMGFSFGAITAHYLAGRQLRGADARDFRAVIGLYGHCFRLVTPDDMKPLLIVIGSEDKWLRGDARGPGCDAFEGKSKVELHALPGAQHGFDNPRFKTPRTDLAGNTMLYNDAATNRARTLFRDFLARQLR